MMMSPIMEAQTKMINAFISRKMWKKRGGLDWKGSKKPHRERKDKDKRSNICYECKKPGHFKSECLDLDKSTPKKGTSSQRTRKY